MKEIKHKHHIIPKHMGGTDTPDNIIEVSVAEHAELHKKLYEKYNYWQDKLAYKGLLGLLSTEECKMKAIKEGGRKGGLKSRRGSDEKPFSFAPLKYPEMFKKLKDNQYGAKKYSLRSPNGERVDVIGLSKWCRKNNLKMNTFHKQVIERKREHKGWKLWN